MARAASEAAMNGSRALFFDLDHTLLRCNSSFRLAHYLRMKGFYSFRELAWVYGCALRFRYGFLPLRSLHEGVFQKLFHGRSSSTVLALTREFVKESLDALWYPPALARLQEAVEQGQFVSIVSSAPHFLVELIAERLGITEFVGSEYCVGPGGDFSALGRIVEGKEKVAYVSRIVAERAFSKEATSAFSDSFLDLPFLEVVGHAVGVNPDRKLSKVCQGRGWEVL